MCKLLIMTGITEGLVAREFIKRMAVPMSRTNSHGIGYTGVGADGELFSERWLNNDMFFDTTNVMVPEVSKQLEAFSARLPKGALETNYSQMGNINFDDVRTLTLHTRFATCGREFTNTHPFIYEDTSLIHNGGISNAFTTHYRPGLDVNKISTCDSEAALQTYLAQGVNRDTKAAKNWLDLLAGSWAFGVLSRNDQNNRILDVVRGTSRLYYMEIEGLGKIFTTDDDDAKAVVKDMGLTFIKDPFFVASDSMYRYDAITGEFLEDVDIKPVYKSYGGSSGKTSGDTTTNSSTNKTTNPSLPDKRAGQNLLALVDAFRDDPDAMSLMPDIFTENSSPKDLKIDHRKVKRYTSDTTYLLIERLDIFDLVFSTNLVNMYKELPPQLKEYIRDIDSSQGCKAARALIYQLYEKKTTTA